jgi:hypothetical protein
MLLVLLCLAGGKFPEQVTLRKGYLALSGTLEMSLIGIASESSNFDQNQAAENRTIISMMVFTVYRKNPTTTVIFSTH